MPSRRWQVASGASPVPLYEKANLYQKTADKVLCRRLKHSDPFYNFFLNVCAIFSIFNPRCKGSK